MDDVFSIYFNTPIDEDTCDSTMALFEEHLYDDTSRTIPSPTYSLPKYEPSITVSELFNPVTPDNGPYTGPSTETSPGQSTTGLPTTGLSLLQDSTLQDSLLQDSLLQDQIA